MSTLRTTPRFEPARTAPPASPQHAPGALPPEGLAPGAGGTTGTPSLKARAIRGTIIWGVAYAALQVIRLGGNVWLGALLAPWAFGMVAIARGIQQGLQMFSELGIRPALVQSARDDDDFVNTAWTLGAIRGVGIWIAASAVAYPMALFYGRDGLVQMVPVLALTAVLSGLESTRVVSMNRELREGPRAAMEVGGAILTRLTMIVWAYVAPTPWALVGGTVAGAVFSLFISHLALPGRVNRFRLESDAVHSILRFGSWIFIGTVIAFLGQQLDKFMLGKLDGLGMLGVYTMALTLTAIPQEIVATLATKILYPVLAAVQRDDPRRYAARVAQIRGVIVPCGMACILGVVFASPWFFGLLYRDDYHDAAWIAPLACGAAWLAILNAPTNRCLLALGKTRPLALAGAIKVVLTAAGCLVGYRALGVAGFVLGVTLGGLGEHASNLLTLRRTGIHLLRADLVATLALAAMALTGWFAPVLLANAMPEALATAAGLLVQTGLLAIAGLMALRRVLPLVTKRPTP